MPVSTLNNKRHNQQLLQQLKQNKQQLLRNHRSLLSHQYRRIDTSNTQNTNLAKNSFSYNNDDVGGSKLNNTQYKSFGNSLLDNTCVKIRQRSLLKSIVKREKELNGSRLTASIESKRTNSKGSPIPQIVSDSQRKMLNRVFDSYKSNLNKKFKKQLQEHLQPLATQSFTLRSQFSNLSPHNKNNSSKQLENKQKLRISLNLKKVGKTNTLNSKKPEFLDSINKLQDQQERYRLNHSRNNSKGSKQLRIKQLLKPLSQTQKVNINNNVLISKTKNNTNEGLGNEHQEEKVGQQSSTKDNQEDFLFITETGCSFDMDAKIEEDNKQALDLMSVNQSLSIKDKGKKSRSLTQQVSQRQRYYANRLSTNRSFRNANNLSNDPTPKYVTAEERFKKLMSFDLDQQFDRIAQMLQKQKMNRRKNVLQSSTNTSSIVNDDSVKSGRRNILNTQGSGTRRVRFMVISRNEDQQQIGEPVM